MTAEPAPTSGFAGLSVRTRIAVAVALLVGLALAGAGLVVYALESARIDRATATQVDQELAEFRELRDSGRDPVSNAPYTDLTRLIEAFLRQNVPGDNELLVGYWNGAPQKKQGDAPEGLLSLPAFERIVDARTDTGGTENLDTPWGEVTVTVQPVADADTTGAFVVAYLLEDEHAELREIIRTYAIVCALSLGLITAVAAWQAGRLLRPLRTLRENAQEITETDLSRRLPETGHDDITALTRTFNEMLARLDTAFTGQREFLDDAGHELKTPLTVIRGHLELLDAADPREVEETKDLLLDEADRMARLVNDLILLAKTERPGFLHRRPVDVAVLTETVLEKCRALGDRGWFLDERADTVAAVDEQRLTQALLQLAENAVKHTGPGDVVALGSSADTEHGLRLWVRDTGPGVADHDKELVFDRFARSDVRSGDEGFGLGLSIVRAIAHAHGGTVHVEDAVPQGARFVLTLPLDPAVRRMEDTWHAS
ncbi:MAG TPA: ATP-binding protein [Nocardioidaceae bacterium]|nr:ATP-binding protein [Nocardioidaceae bacterium]